MVELPITINIMNSTFKAMMVTLAGNIGGGNVVGVATAIVSGGF